MKQENLIEKYIQNRLSLEERLIFEELLLKDKDFEKEVILQLDLKKVIEEKEDNNFKNLISDLELNAEKPNKINFLYKWLVAASIVLLMGLTYFINLDNNGSTKVLFENNFEPYRNIIKPIERATTDLDATSLAFIAYEKGEYKLAIERFTALYIETNEPYLLFYKANGLLKLEKADEAIPLLLTYIKTKDTLTEKSYWYLALAYLKINEVENAKRYLNLVVDTGVYKRKDAKKILKKID